MKCLGKSNDICLTYMAGWWMDFWLLEEPGMYQLGLFKGSKNEPKGAFMGGEREREREHDIIQKSY